MQYRDIVWENDVDLSRKLGKFESHVYLHKKRGESYKTIIDNILDPKFSYREIGW